MVGIPDYLDALLYLGSVSVLLVMVSKLVHTKSTRLMLSLAIITLGLAYRLNVYFGSQDPNLYQVLELHRLASSIEIRHAYKHLSRIKHPDKNLSPNAESEFLLIKTAYDILMDQTKREIYDKFGSSHLSFDPRVDEVRFFARIMYTYVFWGACAYVMSVTKGAASARVWMIIAGIVMFVCEATFLFSSMPDLAWGPIRHWTEGDVISLSHLCFPAIMGCLKVLGEFYFVDIDRSTAIGLLHISQGLQAIQHILTEFQELNNQSSAAFRHVSGVLEQYRTSSLNSKSSDLVDTSDSAISTGVVSRSENENSETELEPSQPNESTDANDNVDIRKPTIRTQTNEINEKMLQDYQHLFSAAAAKLELLQGTVNRSNGYAVLIATELQKSCSNLGENYYWIVFVAMYGVIFLL